MGNSQLWAKIHARKCHIETLPTKQWRIQDFNRSARSHREKANAKAKKIKQNFAFASDFVWCEWALTANLVTKLKDSHSQTGEPNPKWSGAPTNYLPPSLKALWKWPSESPMGYFHYRGPLTSLWTMPSNVMWRHTQTNIHTHLMMPAASKARRSRTLNQNSKFFTRS